MIDVIIHRRVLLNILKDIYGGAKSAAWLGFKGGTCLYLFHDLPRFSVDLDFDLLVDEGKFEPAIIHDILKKYIAEIEYSDKRHTYFWMGSYKKGNRHVKVEISKRGYGNKYAIIDLYGLGVNCMEKSYLFAHKLCAIQDRKQIANRDLFDAHFMFQQMFPIAEEIVKERMGMSPKKYFQALVKYIPKHANKRGILDSMGELLDERQKKWAKEHLIDELLFYLRGHYK